MWRRAVLATVGAVGLAGCGWSQEGETEPESGGNLVANDSDGDGGTTDERGGDGQADDSSADPGGSEGRESLIDREPVELLLTVEDFGSPEWERRDLQRTGTCRGFERVFDEVQFFVDSCVELFDDEETAIEEYEGVVDRGVKLMGDRLGVDRDIGDAAAVTQTGNDVRVVFRDSNAYGIVEFDMEGPLGEQPVPGVSEIVELAATMHGHWRS